MLTNCKHLVALILFLVGRGMGWGQPGTATEVVRRPVLVELFTSEGCSSCPPADRLLAELDRTQPVNGAEIVVLSEHVDYWDSLGWKDPASSPQFTLRQQFYARHLRVENPYTPELVVDGHRELVGGRAEEAKVAIAEEALKEKIRIRVATQAPVADRVHVVITVESGSRRAGGAKVYLAVAANETHSSVGNGENAGRQLRHVAVVRTLDEVGPLKGSEDFRREVSLKVRPAELPNLRVIAFIQDPKSLEVLGAAALLR